MTYIKEHVVREIETKKDVQDVIGEYVDLRQKGSSYIGDCPFCNKKDKFSVKKPKAGELSTWRCWSAGCDASGVGYVHFVRRIKGFDYPQTLKFLADQFNIKLEYEQAEIPVETPNRLQPGKSPKANKTLSFRDIQLKESGLSDVDQKYRKRQENLENGYIEIDRYQKGSVNPDWSIDPSGDDMVMHYMDLNGNPMKYHRKGFTKDYPLIRVRYANPAVHLDKNGRPMKYQSPPGSGTHVWINQQLRTLYENGSKIETLYVQEGEKKADKATKHGVVSVGIMGIHNIASNKQLPREFELIIKKCDVKNVVFIVDGDFLDISDNLNNPVDQRPKSFLRAILNFHDYFYALNNSGISLNIYFGYIRPDQNEKGIDDLFTNKFKGNEGELVSDLTKTLLEVKGEGKYINVHKITNVNEFKLRKDFFHMENNQTFANFHKEKLKARGIFRIGRELFKFSNKEEHPDMAADTLILAQPLSAEEEFWEEKNVKRGDMVTLVTSFKYVECCVFLSNRKFGKHKVGSDGDFNFIKLDGNVVRTVKPSQIKEYLMDFTRYALQKKNVLEMLYKGAKMYLSDNLNNIDYINLKFHKADKGVQYIYFTETFWKIDAEGVQEKPISELDGHVWADSIKDFKAHRMNPMIKVEKDDQGRYRLKFPSGVSVAKKCHFFNYLWNTSNFYWRDTHEGLYAKKSAETEKKELDDFQLNDIMLHFISKCVAMGFMCHTYFDPNNAKAVVAMDGKLSEVGSSNGRSGKSLMGDALFNLLPTVNIPGKQKDLMEDKFIWDGITESTRVVNIDDVRTNFDFEALFSNINGYWKINPKGAKPFNLPRESSPKIFLTTNHALNGEGGSFRDRQFLIAFSDYYNEDYRPIDDSGVRFFDEWDHEQWNLFYNLIGCCLQIYFEHGLIQAPMDRIEQRRLRQQIGEAMIEWAEHFYDPERETNIQGEPGANLNKDLERNVVTSDFFKEYPHQAKYIDNRKFKQLLKQWCKYKGYEFNPGCKNGDHKSGGKEYFTVADAHYKKQADPF